MGKRRVVVLGAGSSGEHFVGALRKLDADAEITIVERHLAGGECSYYACIPTKTLLRPTEALAGARIAPGAAEAVTGELDMERVFWWRDQVTDGRDDSCHAGWLADQRATLVRGEARVVRPGLVEVEGRDLEFDALVIATGSSPAVPPIEGIEDVGYWTNHEAIWAGEVPESLVVLGGGPVGVELGQFFHRSGARVTIVDGNSHLLGRLAPEAGQMLAERLSDEGIEIRHEARVTRAEPTGDGVRLELEGGETLEASRLLVATGRRPNVEGFGFEQLCVEITKQGISVDERLRATDGVWAIGDV